MGAWGCASGKIDSHRLVAEAETLYISMFLKHD
jgi:hypothetical protein